MNPMVNPCSGDDSRTALCEFIDKTAADAVSKNMVSALAIRADIRGEKIHEGFWGDCSDSAIVPLFDIASLTKIFTATAILRLVTLKKVSLENALCEIECICRVTEGKKNLTGAFRNITIRDLLNHSSGMRYWYPFYASGRADFHEILEDILGKYPLEKKTIYSDINFMILGKIVECVHGAPLNAAMRDLVFGPLGLENTSYAPVPEDRCVKTEFGNRIEKKMVSDLELSFKGWRDDSKAIRGQPNDGNCHYYFNDRAGHAGIFSTPADLCALGRLYVDIPEIESENAAAGFLDRQLVLEARLDHGNGRGLGFQMGDLYPSGGFGHTGFTGTYLYLNADRGIVLAVLANRLHTDELQNINDLRKSLAGGIVATEDSIDAAL